MANKDFKVKNGLDVSTPIPVSMGGTGQTSTANTLNSLLPSQSGNSNKVLSTDGTNTTWAAQAVAYQRGGTASRPASPTAGDLYYNTDTNIFEQYTSLGWFAIAVAPGAPTGVTATNQGTSRAFNNGQMSVAFTAGTSGGAPTSFILTPNPATSPTTFTSGSSPIVVTGLSSSTQYTHTVVSTSPYGTSAASSASSAVTATTVPQAPSLVATTLSETSVSIAITAGSTGGSAITGYSITSNPATTTQTTSSSPYTFTGLTTGTAYTFTAYASNALGDSATSTASNSVTPVVIPVGSFESIASQRLTSPQQSITFSSIPQGFKHLQVRWVGGFYDNYPYLTTNLGNTGKASRIAYYNDTFYNNANYIQDSTYGAELFFGGVGNNNPAGGIIDILDYSSTTKAKYAKSQIVRPYSGAYTMTGIFNFELGYATTAITSLTVQGTAAYPMVTGSTVSLYGIKGA